MGLAEDIRGFLSTQGYTAASVFCGDLPERPQKALAVIPTAGLGSMHTFGSVAGAAPLEHLRFQLLARATDYPEAETVAILAHAILDGLRTEGMNGKLYQWISGVSAPTYLGLDDEERALFSCNYDVQRSNTT